MNTVPAWILSLSATRAVSVGRSELVHTLTDLPKLFTIPKTPYYCQHVMLWQKHLVPVMNLSARFLPVTAQTEIDALNDLHRLGALSIFAYQAENTQQLAYGALLLHAVPQRCEVSDTQHCALPSDFASWRYYVTSCFQTSDTEKAVPILCLERLFATPRAHNA